jgi:hypothetical protein
MFDPFRFDESRVRDLVAAYVRANDIKDTSIAHLVRALSIKAEPDLFTSELAFRQMMGRALSACGFRPYRVMLAGVRGLRHRCTLRSSPPPAHDPPLQPREFLRWPAPGFAAERRAEVATPSRRRGGEQMRDRVTAALYLGRVEFEDVLSAAMSEGLSLSAYVRTLIRLAKPHCPPGAVRRAFEEDQRLARQAAHDAATAGGGKA